MPSRFRPSRLPRGQEMSYLAAAMTIALTSFMGGAQAGPAVAHWTVLDLGKTAGGLSINSGGQVAGSVYDDASPDTTQAVLYSNGTSLKLPTLGGSGGGAYGINDEGQVAGWSYIAGRQLAHAFVYSGGQLKDLGTLGGVGEQSFAHGINRYGQVAGWSQDAQYGRRAFLYSNGAMRDIGTLGGASSYAMGINDFAQVTGTAERADGFAHAFLYSQGTMADLGTLGGNYSQGWAINRAGQVVGSSRTIDGFNHAFLYSSGRMTDLGAPVGEGSEALAINNAAQVAGYSYTSSGSLRAFVYVSGRMSDPNGFNGVAQSRLTLQIASGINDVGQMTGIGTTASGSSHAFLLTLDTTVWETNTGGNWDDAANWSHGFAPNRNAHVIIDPSRSITLHGPSGLAQVKRLTVGTDSTGGGGIATLRLNGGTISAVGDDGSGNIGWQGVWVGKNGVLTGDGVVAIDSALGGALFNYGTMVADNVRVQGANATNAQLLNHGLIAGNAFGPARIVSSYMVNGDEGRIRVLAGERLTIESTLSNSGSIEVLGGQFTHVSGDMLHVVSTGAAVGRMVAQNALLTFQGGLDIYGGAVTFSAGNSNVFGRVLVQRSVADNRGGQLIVTGNSQVAFNDAVDVQSGGELRVSSGATAVFLGSVRQYAGAVLSGGGTKFFEGGLSLGDAPSAVRDAGSAEFGAANSFLANLGGTEAGGFDTYAVMGSLRFGGTLHLRSWQGFVAQAGQNFDLFDWGSVSGTFYAIDASELQLASGTALDTSRLYIDGSISVQAVPEPRSWALMLGGIAVMAWRQRSVRASRAARV